MRLNYGLLATLAATVSAIPFPIRSRRSEGRRSVPLAKRAGSGAADLLGDLGNFRYEVNITFGGQTVPVILDTGSSSTFIYGTIPQGTPASVPAYDYTVANITVTDIVYNASYGASDAGGTTTLGYATIGELALPSTDLSVDNFTLAILTDASSGNGAAGLMGLSFAFPEALNYNFGFQVEYAQATNRTPGPEILLYYYPITNYMYAKGVIPANIFSLYLQRAANDQNAQTTSTSNGTFWVGEYPTGMSESDFSFSTVPTTNLSSPELVDFFGGDFTQIGWQSIIGTAWTIALEAVYLNGTMLTPTSMLPNGTTESDIAWALLDSGTPTMTLPPDVLSQITNAWAANPQNNTIPCDTVLVLELQFNGVRYPVDARDLIVPSTEAIDSIGTGGFATTACQVQIQELAPIPDSLGVNTSVAAILGDTFMRNVYSVFDYGSLDDAATTPPRIGLKAVA